MSRIHKTLLIICCATALLAEGRPGAAQIGPSGEVPGRLILELTDAAAQRARRGTLDLPIPAGYASRAPVLAPLFKARSGPLSRIMVLSFAPTPGLGNPEWLEVLLASDAVRRGEADRVMSMSALPDDPYFLGGNGLPRQAQLYNPGNLSIQAHRAWPFVPADSRVVVAVLDTGVHWQHEDLGGGSTPGTGVIWRNDSEHFGLPGVDDDENGFIDDVIGWDFVEVDSIDGNLGGAAPVVGEDGHVPDNNPSDYAGHGTRVAGTITAQHNNALGLAAAAPGARIMPVRVGWSSGVGPVVFMSFCAAGLEYAAVNGAQVVNCSWDSQNLFGLGLALDLAIQQLDVVVVGSAGNSSTTSTASQYLASRPDVLGVAGLNLDGKKAPGSNYGTWVALSAFYSSVLSTSFSGASQTAGYATLPNGTSFAAPQVAAAAAVVRMLDPQLNQSQVRSILQSTALDLTSYDPVYGDRLGSGLVDIAGAARLASGGWEIASPAQGLTPLVTLDGDPSGELAWFGASILEVREGVNAAPAPGWDPPLALGDSLTALPFVARRDDRVWVHWLEGHTLHARWTSDLTSDPGRSWSLPGDPAQGLAVRDDSLGEDVLYVPHGDGVTRISSALSAVGVHASATDVVTELPWAWTNMAAGIMAGDVVLVGLDDEERVEARRPDGSVLFTTDAGAVSAGPVIAEFDGPGSAYVMVGGPDPAPGHQRLRWIDDTGAIIYTTVIEAPELVALSAAGFIQLQRAVGVAVDAAGGIHVARVDGWLSSLAAGGPVVGEVLSADVDGDYRADLVALREDGTLLGWDESLAPLPTFPRHFPFATEVAPAVVDDGPLRRVVVADQQGSVWGIPLGRADGPAPWPTLGGTASRQSYLGHDRAVPEAAAAVLRQTADGVCWIGSAFEDLTRLRLTQEGQVVWEGVPAPEGCVSLDIQGGPTHLRLEGIGRDGIWFSLGELDVIPQAGLKVSAPTPNPMRSQMQLSWSGARDGVLIEILDVRGRRITGARDGASVGAFTWDGKDERGYGTPAGVYFIRLRSAEQASVVRRVLRIP